MGGSGNIRPKTPAPIIRMEDGGSGSGVDIAG